MEVFVWYGVVSLSEEVEVTPLLGLSRMTLIVSKIREDAAQRHVTQKRLRFFGG